MSILGNKSHNLIRSSTGFATGANTTETNFSSYTIPAGMLSSTNDFVSFYARGMTASGTDTKTIKAFFDSTLILDTGAVAYSGGWEMEVKVIRLTSTTVLCQEKFLSTRNTGDLDNSNINTNSYPSPSLTVANMDSNGLTFQIKVTNGVATANLITQNWFEVWLIN